MNEIVARLIGALKQKQGEIAESSMLRPSSDAMTTGLYAGRYQGLQVALDTIDALLRDEYEEKS